MDDRLTLETPEHVALDLPVAGIGHRALAWSIDAGILFLFWVTAILVFSVVIGPLGRWFSGMASLARIAAALLFFATNWGYHAGFEIAWAGQSPGKRLMGIRIVRVDGSPEAPLEAVVRNLARAVDFLPAGYLTGMIAVIATGNRRLGDLLAGTVAIKERAHDLDRYAMSATPSPSAPALTAAQYEAVTSFLARRDELLPDARERVALALARSMLAQPPGDALEAEERLAAAAAGYGAPR